MAQLTKDFPNDFLFVYRNFPLMSIHDKAALATQAAEAAGRQQKFWEMHDVLFLRSSEWTGLSVQQFESWLQDRAKELNLDVNKFMTDLKSAELVQFAIDAVDQCTEFAYHRHTVRLAQRFYLSNSILSYDNLSAIIKMIKLEKERAVYLLPADDHRHQQNLHRYAAHRQGRHRHGVVRRQSPDDSQ